MGPEASLTGAGLRTVITVVVVDVNVVVAAVGLNLLMLLLEINLITQLTIWSV